MDGEEVIGEVAEKDCAGTVMGELVSAGAADTKGRVGAFNFSATVRWVAAGGIEREAYADRSR